MSSRKAPTWTGNSNYREYPLPEGFVCHMDGKWRPVTKFSKNQLKKWHNKKRSPNAHVTPSNAGLICRDHSGEPALQLQCNGPCGQQKIRDKFSRSQRRNKLRWCSACVRWQLLQGTEDIPSATPGGINDSSSEIEGATNAAHTVSYVLDDEAVADYGAYNDGDNDSTATDNEDDDAASGTGHYFDGDSDGFDGSYDDDDDDDDDEIVRVSNLDNGDDGLAKGMVSMTLSSHQPVSQPAQAATHATATASGMYHEQRPAQTQPRSFANVAAGRSQTSPGTLTTQASTEPSRAPSVADRAADWVPPHLLASENINTLRDAGLSNRHFPGAAQVMTSAGGDKPIPPHLRGLNGVPPHLRAVTPLSSSSNQSRIPSHTDGSVSGHSSITAHTRANVSDFLTGSTPTASAPSTDSRAGVPTMSMNSVVSQSRQGPTAQSFNAFDPQGNAHPRIANRGTSTAGSTPASARATQGMPGKRSDKNGWARPSRRKQFDQLYREQAREGVEHHETYYSGSDDEM
ncbi:hypothetical protein JX266_007345 [Neoarthrinium moseri]|nr:hypothetical protein JX266_007345 [Neoarthrinium moseri]